MDSKISIKELLEQLYLPEFESWRIEKDSGNFEKFTPTILLSSLIESEIPIDDAFLIYDLVIKYIDKNLNTEKLSHKKIHKSVVEVLLSSDLVNNLEWLRNYDNIFGPDINLISDKDEYVKARNASVLKNIIIQYFLEHYDLSNFEQLETYISNEELTVSTNRIIKIIRYCGFYKVSKRFIFQLCEELAFCSMKGYLPVPQKDQFTINNSIEEAEFNIKLSVRAMEKDPSKFMNLLSLAFEGLAQAILSKHGIIYSRSSLNTFSKFINLLKEGEANTSSNNGEDNSFICLDPPTELYSKIESILQRANINYLNFIKKCSSLCENLNKKRFDLAGEIYTISLEIFNYFEIILENHDKINSLAGYVQDNKIINYYQILDQILSERGFNTSLLLSEYEISFDISRIRSDLLQYTSTIIIKSFPLVTDENQYFQNVIKYIEDNLYRESAIIFISQLPLSKDNITEFKRFVIKNSLIAYCTTFFDLEKILFYKKDIPQKIFDSFKYIFPQFNRTYNIVFDTPRLNQCIPKYYKNRIEEEIRNFEDNHYVECIGSVAIIFENIICSHILFLIEFSLQHNLTFPSEAIFSEINQGLGGYLLALKKMQEVDILKKFIPVRQDLDLFHSVKNQRNQLIHGEIPVSKIKTKRFLNDCIESINRYFSKYFHREIGCIYLSNNILCFVNDDSSKIIDVNKACCELFNHNLTNCIASLVPSKTSKKYLVIYQPSLCTKCGSMSYTINYNQTAIIKCKKCKETFQARDFYRFLFMETSNSLSLFNSNAGGVSIMDNSYITKFNWIKALGDGLSTAVGPLGAPLKFLLSLKNDEDTDKFNKNIETLFETNNGKIDDIVSLLSQKSNNSDQQFIILKDILINISKKLNKITGGDLDECFRFISSKRWPFFASTNITEKELKDELLRLYNDINLLKTDLVNCGFPVERVNFSNTLENDISNIVIALRSRRLSFLKEIFDYLYSKNDGSVLLLEMTSILRSHAVLEEEYISKMQEYKQLN